MFPATAAASSAIDALKALTSTKPATGVKQDAPNLFAFSADASASPEANSGSGGGKSSPISPETMSALLAAQSQSGPGASAPHRADTLKDLFSQIDGDGDGKLTKSQFETALGAGGTNVAEADDVFSKLDRNDDGSVSLGELLSALKGRNHDRHRTESGPGESGESDLLLQALQGASSTKVTNADGSVTTSLTDADGSKVTMTSAATASASGTAASSYNFIEQLISTQTNSSLSVSV